MRHHDLIRVASCALPMALGAVVSNQVAVAQDQQLAQAPALEEIVVTARKREENLMEVPMAVSALSADDIQDAGIRDLNTLALYTPGLWAEFGLVSRANRQLTFRGLSVASGVVFIDGAPYAGNGTPNLANLERVEVLVGPQSAYFGRATFTGAVNFVTKNPSDEFQGEVRAEYGKFDTYEGSISVEGPLVEDKIGFRINARRYRTGGQYKGFTTPDYTFGRLSSTSVTSSLVWTPSDPLRVKLLADYVVDDDGLNYSFALKGNKEIFCQLGGTAGAYYCGPLPSAKGFDRVVSAITTLDAYYYDLLVNNTRGFPVLFSPNFSQNTGARQESKSLHVNIDYDYSSDWTLSAVTGLHNTRTQNIFSPQYRDARGTPNPLFPGTPAQSRTPDNVFLVNSQTLTADLSQEVRLTSPQDARWRGTMGGNYLRIRNPGAISYGQAPTGVSFIQGQQTRAVTRTPALFGGVYYDLTSELTVGAEARYQWDYVYATPIFPNRSATVSGLFKSFSPRVTIDYRYAEGSMAYALFSRGYRPGGFNNVLVGASAFVRGQLEPQGAARNFAQEKLDNYEVGWKATWLDNRLQSTIDVYYDIWSQGQVPNTLFYLTDAGTQAQTTLVVNVGKVHLKGVESQFDMAVTNELTVSATLNYQTSDIKSYIYLPEGPRIYGSTQVTGNKFQGAPDWTWTLSPTYRTTLTGDWDWFARLDWRHRGKYMIDPTNVAWIPPSDVVDARLGVENETTSLEFYVKNLTDDREFLNGGKGNDAIVSAAASSTNEIRVIFPNKRSFGARASYKF